MAKESSKLSTNTLTHIRESSNKWRNLRIPRWTLTHAIFRELNNTMSNLFDDSWITQNPKESIVLAPEYSMDLSCIIFILNKSHPRHLKTFKLTFLDLIKLLKVVLLVKPSCPDPRQREEINLNFYFHTFLWCHKRFFVGIKDLHKTFLMHHKEVRQ